MRRSRPTTARGPRYGIAFSALFHGLIFVAAMFSFHRSLQTPEDSHVVPVDLVTIAKETNIAAQAPPVPEPKTVALAKIDMPPPMLEPPPEPELQEVEPAPVPPMPKFTIAKEKPKPVPKPVPAKKTPQQDFNALLAKLTTPDKPAKNVKAGPRTVQGVGAGTQMTADLADALKAQIYHCWSPPLGAPNPEDLVLDFELQLNPDGSVDHLTLLTLPRNSYASAAADSVRFAISKCAPFRLPPDRYNQWRDIRPLRFDPRQMMNQ